MSSNVSKGPETGTRFPLPLTRYILILAYQISISLLFLLLVSVKCMLLKIDCNSVVESQSSRDIRSLMFHFHQ